MQESTPRSLRLHISIFGRRNVGKSSLLNALTGQGVAIVSEVAGTTTDPVEKAMELTPVGPVVFVDTAGIDDAGALGERRIQATRKVFERTELALLVAAAGEWTDFEARLLAELTAQEIPVIVVFNKADLARPAAELTARLARRVLAVAETAASSGAGIEALRWTIKRAVPEDMAAPTALVADLLPPGALAVLVVPIDKEAPKGRLILAQVQVIRDLLDADAMCLVVQERELRAALARLKDSPGLVVTDSQAFVKVAADTPLTVPMTSFSILFARYKGDLVRLARGAAAIDRLRPGDLVLIAEACTHHPIGDDIGRVKIPRWLEQYAGGALQIDMCAGRDFPDELAPYKLVIHCGACTWNRRQVMFRIRRCEDAGVPITNYGITIAHVLGICRRALQPFPAALDAYLGGVGEKARRAVG